jgi:hypothetical protein
MVWQRAQAQDEVDAVGFAQPQVYQYGGITGGVGA